ncbi:polymeric immunoglobulin receptor-like isoform X2 [Tubulanus polymorphus]|uniref:polymeric immunoglobulin receptor-like isoform X2 n=1 Tax=Tubulanus polymorphus TaxID=672921 RepID=UPI003DA3870D
MGQKAKNGAELARRREHSKQPIVNYRVFDHKEEAIFHIQRVMETTQQYMLFLLVAAMVSTRLVTSAASIPDNIKMTISRTSAGRGDSVDILCESAMSNSFSLLLEHGDDMILSGPDFGNTYGNRVSNLAITASNQCTRPSSCIHVRLSNLQLKDAGAYKCSQGRYSQIKHLKIDSVLIHGPDSAIPEGGTIRIRCEIHEPVISKYVILMGKNGMVQNRPIDVTSDDRRVDVEFKIPNAKLNDAGSYQCFHNNHYSGKISVQVGMFVVSANYLAPPIGGAVDISCTRVANGPIDTTSKSLMLVGPSGNLVVDGTSCMTSDPRVNGVRCVAGMYLHVQIRQFSAADQGEYSCHFGRFKSEPLSLSVGKPIAEVTIESDSRVVEEGDSLGLKCRQISAMVSPGHREKSPIALWRKDGQSKQPSATMFAYGCNPTKLRDGVRVTKCNHKSLDLTINHVTPDDAGWYFCNVNSQKAWTYVHVIKKDLQQRTTEPTTTKNSASSATASVSIAK